MKTIQYKFVEFIPDTIDEGVLYISVEYCTAVHKCVCGCGNEVVTPLSPIDWRLIFDGKTVSLFPSIGNWNFDCQSHYWIDKNEIKLANRWSEKEIKQGRDRDMDAKKAFYADNEKDVKSEKLIEIGFGKRILKIIKKLIA